MAARVRVRVGNRREKEKERDTFTHIPFLGKDQGAKAAPAAAVPKPRKKKLYWKALDASKVGRDSLWADQNDGDILLDEDEFNKLFVDRCSTVAISSPPSSSSSSSSSSSTSSSSSSFFIGSGEPQKKDNQPEKEKKEPKKTKVILINMKRAQNAGIALARIKMSFEEIKKK